VTYKTENPFRNMHILTGNLKTYKNAFHLVWKINKTMPLISVERYKKETSNPSVIGKVMFEVDFPSEHLLPMNYISQFSINKSDYIVVSRLLTSKFAIVSLESEPMKCHYFGVDALTNIITAIHCCEDSKTIICGYQSGSIALWNIREINITKSGNKKHNENVSFHSISNEFAHIPV
jgi:hypothetical protein